jgi:hypothetical protein
MKQTVYLNMYKEGELSAYDTEEVAKMESKYDIGVIATAVKVEVEFEPDIKKD